METISQKYQYSYQDGNLEHHHTYLITPLLNMLSKIANTSSNQLNVLDIGCGNGSLTKVIAKQGYQIIGIEESESGVRYANDSTNNCDFIQGSIYEEPPQKLKQSFDIVISTKVIEHLYYPKELARYARKCLKPQGKFIVTTPYHGYFKNLVMAVTGKMDGHFTSLWDGGHIKFFSVKTLQYLLKSQGFTEFEFDFAGRYPFLWKSMLCSCTLNSERL